MCVISIMFEYSLVFNLLKQSIVPQNLVAFGEDIHYLNSVGGSLLHIFQ